MKIVESIPPRASYKHVAIDLELFGADKYKLHRPFGRLAALTICPDGETVYVIKREADVEKALARVNAAQWIFHNSTFDLAHLRRWADVPVRKMARFWDTLIVERILWNGYFDSFGLDHLTRRYLNQVMDKSVRKKFIDGDTMTPEMLEYAAYDTVATWQIWRHQEPLIVEDKKSLNVWMNIDGPAIWAVLDFKGITLNVKAWKELAHENEEIAVRMQAQLGFNPGSPKQTLAALRAKGIKVDSTGEDVLEPYKDSPMVAKILAYREASKLAGTYGQDMIDNQVEADGRIYSNFNVTGAKTGRMSSDDPNLQNIPRDIRYRACFIAPRGRRLMIADVNQQEPRITAQLSRDPELLKCFEEGEDSHLTVTRAVFQDPTLTKADKEKRKIGKAINLGLVYGLTSYGLAPKIGRSEQEAGRLLAVYFQRFKHVAIWMKASRTMAGREGFVRTLAGRKQHLNTYSRQWLNHAVNTPVQGSAADAIKLTLVKLHEQYGQDLPVDIIVHDEIVAEAPTGDINKVKKNIIKAMDAAMAELAPNVSRRNLVDAHVGKTWADKG